MFVILAYNGDGNASSYDTGNLYNPLIKYIKTLSVTGCEIININIESNC